MNISKALYSSSPEYDQGRLDLGADGRKNSDSNSLEYVLAHATDNGISRSEAAELLKLDQGNDFQGQGAFGLLHPRLPRAHLRQSVTRAIYTLRNRGAIFYRVRP